MKVQIKIKEITHEDLVNLFSTGLYGSTFLGADYPNLDIYEEGECFEDKLAKALLAGHTIEINDMYAEDKDDCYGELPHYWDGSYGCMRYTITLKDVAKGIEKALANGGYDAKCAQHLVDDDAYNLDLPEAENLLQIIVFGEAVYG